jgi:hypothetical protein
LPGWDATVLRKQQRLREHLQWAHQHGVPDSVYRFMWFWMTFAWLNQFRRLRVRYDKRADIHEAFLSLGCALICWHALRKRWGIG